MKLKYLFYSIILFISVQLNAQKIEVPLRFDMYYTYAQVNEALRALHNAYPKFTTLEVIGKSEENRDIYALTINNPATGSHLSKPAVYVDGNIHGNEIQAGEVCLYFANYLLTNYEDNKTIQKLVDKNAYYIIPVVNVDGRYHFFADANTSSTNRGLRIPRDDDNDGLFDEDFPDDLDGDGNICMMRKKDPLGKLKTDPEDDRLMIPVKDGEMGEWTILGQEGIDNDGDGRINEDSEGYVDPNRNWGHNWEPDYVQRGAGNFPFSGTGTKAISEFLMARPNIIIVFAFHNSGGMFLRGPGTKSQGDPPLEDLEVLDLIGENSEKIVPGYEYLISWKDLYTTYGDFTDFTDNVIGSYSFVGELFQSSSETYSTEEATSEDDGWTGETNNKRSRERLDFNDHLAHGELYKEWKPYNHPVYGEIEIGGYVKMSSRLPHPFMLQDLVHRNASAVIFAAEQTPEIKMEIFDIEKLSGNLNRVRVRLVNKKAIPSMALFSERNKIHRNDILKVSGNGIKVVSGGKLTDRYNNEVTFKEYKPEIQFIRVPGNSYVEYEFLVSGKGKLTIEFNSLKAKNTTQTITL